MSDASIPVRDFPVGKLMGVQIVGTGSFLPDNIVTNADLTSLGCDPEWIVQRTGIHERRHAPLAMNTSDMAVAAAERALEKGGIDKNEIDLLLLATFTPDRLMPASATTVQHRLGLACGAVDMNAACSGFTYALATGMQFIATGSCRKVLVIGADLNSRVVNPAEKQTYPLFGDGAGAVVLAPASSEQGALAFSLGSDGSGADLLCRQSGGVARPFDPACWYMQMEGRPIFKWAVRLADDVLRRLASAAELPLDQIDWWIFHQANVRILDAAAQSLGIERERVIMHLNRYGNTSAASIPIALDESVCAGQIKRGQNLMMFGFGAGLTWGGVAFRW